MVKNLQGGKMSRQFKLLSMSLLLAFPMASMANTVKLHISESNVAGVKTEIPTAQEEAAKQTQTENQAGRDVQLLKFSESNTQGKVIYLNNDSSKELNPSNIKDAKALGSSVEFEVYQINDKRVSYAVFESSAGVCYGFQSPAGANLTDSTTYYMDKKLADYYLSVVGANVSAKDAPKNVQYSPVFFIQDPELSKKIQQEEKVVREYLIRNNIDKNTAILTNIVCK